MCGPGFVARAAEAADLAGAAVVAAQAGVPAPEAAQLQAARAGLAQVDVAVSAGDVIGFCVTGAPDDAGVAPLTGPAVGPAGAGLGVERALLRRAVEGAAGRGVRALRAYVPAGDPLRLALFTAQGFVRTPAADAGDRLALTRTL